MWFTLWMWTPEQRGRMARIARKTKRYPSDLTDEEWARIAPLMPAPGRRGRPREVEFREVINAVRYLVRSGGGWRMLPIHFGHWRTVYGWFRELARRFPFQTIHDVELMLDRERAGREASPTAAVSTAEQFWCGGRSKRPSLRRRVGPSGRAHASQRFRLGGDRWGGVGVVAVGWPSSGSCRRSSRGCGRGG